MFCKVKGGGGSSCVTKSPWEGFFQTLILHTALSILPNAGQTALRESMFASYSSGRTAIGVSLSPSIFFQPDKLNFRVASRARFTNQLQWQPAAPLPSRPAGCSRAECSPEAGPWRWGRSGGRSYRLLELPGGAAAAPPPYLGFHHRPGRRCVCLLGRPQSQELSQWLPFCFAASTSAGKQHGTQ